MSCERPNVLTTIKLHNSLGLDYFKSISHSFLLPSGVRAVLLMTQGVRWACSKEVIHPGTPGCHQVPCYPDPWPGVERGPKWVRISPHKIKNWEHRESTVPRTGVMGWPSSTTAPAESRARKRRKQTPGAEAGAQSESQRPLVLGSSRGLINHLLCLGSSKYFLAL